MCCHSDLHKTAGAKLAGMECIADWIYSGKDAVIAPCSDCTMTAVKQAHARAWHRTLTSCLWMLPEKQNGYVMHVQGTSGEQGCVQCRKVE